MNTTKYWLLTFYFISVYTVGFGADWPQFRGLNRDGKSPETGLLKRWPDKDFKPFWTVKGLGIGYSGPAVANHTVYVTGMDKKTHEGTLFAFDLEGKPKWQIPYGTEWHTRYPGTRSTPTVEGNSIYLLTGMGNLLCFNTESGKIQWARNIAKEFGGKPPACGFAEGLLIYNEKLICTPGGKDACMVALDKTNGKTIWTTKGFSEQAAYCSPILVKRGGKDIIITITAHHLIGVNPENGDLYWRHPFDPKAKDPNHSITPVYQDGNIYITSGHRKGGMMVEISPDGLKVNEKWTDKVLGCVHSGLVLVDGYIYGTSNKKKWICLELNNGNVKYQKRGLGTASVAYADGMLFCYSQKGVIGLVKASPKGYELLSSVKVPYGNGQHWAHPVISGGRLYIRHGDVMMAYGISKPMQEK